MEWSGTDRDRFPVVNKNRNYHKGVFVKHLVHLVGGVCRVYARLMHGLLCNTKPGHVHV